MAQRLKFLSVRRQERMNPETRRRTDESDIVLNATLPSGVIREVVIEPADVLRLIEQLAAAANRPTRNDQEI